MITLIQFANEETNFLAALEYSALPLDDDAHTGYLFKRNIQVDGGRKLAFGKRGGQRGSHRVIKHRRKESALNIAGWVGKFRLSLKFDFDGTEVRIDSLKHNSQYCCDIRWW